MGCTSSKEGVAPPGELLGSKPLIYLDPDDRQVEHQPNKHKTNDLTKEWAYVSGNDSSVVSGGEEYYLISSIWLQRWLDAARPGESDKPKTAKNVGPINNSSLLREDDDYSLRENVKFKKDYRAVSKKVWEFFFQTYGEIACHLRFCNACNNSSVEGGGPVILFYVPTGFKADSYKTGSWMKSANISTIIKVVSF